MQITNADIDLKPLFIFSLPRSGSTLTQRILAAHKDIATVSEPHILLPYLYSLKAEGIYSKYNHKLLVRALEDFCCELPNGVEDYYAEIQTLAMRLYAKATKGRAKYFLDKTPGYHLIVEDIIRLFPDGNGKFIFLWRNPLAAISSRMSSWVGGRWSLYLSQVSLFEGQSNLIEAYEKHADQVCAVRYEDLLTNPMEEFQRIFSYLELAFDPEVLSSFNNIELKGRPGDKLGVKNYQTLSKEPLEKWKNILANPIRKAWCRRYLRWIGRERLAVMGYDLDELLAELDTIPFSLSFVGSDMWWIPYGIAYRLFEGRVMKHKLQAVLSGQWNHIHALK